MDEPQRVVAAITIQPAEAKTNVGKRLPLDVLALDPKGNELENQDIVWMSADTLVATVSDKGEVTARRVGSTVITATDGSKTGTATLTVLAAQVASVALSPASATLLAGDTARFAAQPHDDEAQPIGGRSVKWSVANPAIATVAGGVLVGLAAGKTVVRATVDGVSDSAIVQVSARPVASVSIVPGTVTLTSGKSTKLATTVLDDRGNTVVEKSVTWSSDNEKVATVSTDGTVSALSTGTATITATATGKGSSGKGKIGKGQVKVTTGTAPVASVTVTPSAETLVTSTTVQLSATAKDSSGTALGGRTVSWSSSNTAAATVSSSGVVSAVAPGKSTIKATIEGVAGAAAITVTLPPVASVNVSPSSANVNVGKSVTLSATTLDASGKTLTGRSITWSSGKSSVATVTSSGVVTGVAAGSAWIYAASEGQRDSAAITVTLPAVASVSVSPSSASLMAGDTKTLAATLKDASGATLTGRTITWVSSDQSVATVSSAGLVTAVAAGTATVTAASEGKSGTSSITVSAPEPPASEPPTTNDPPPSDGSDGGSHSGVFVSPSGSSTASGSESSPISLSAALSGAGGKVSSGDTVWVRAGTYSGRFSTSLSASSSAPIIIRAYPGERANINGTLTVSGSNVWFWGLEVSNTNGGEQETPGVTSTCSGCRFINMLIHDHSSNGLQVWDPGSNQEAYGNIIYNNG
ncbi:MAG TPA: Ig-like domain-containing protein, partial [Gemmatimonadaceae bacterium]|nr:Ig-like domain-containing protein [Gemmatimonadaceae bacterium]